MNERKQRQTISHARTVRFGATTTAAMLAAPLLLVLAANLAGCAPEPKTVRCQNDGECTRRGDGLKYCLESKCVKCAGRADCRDGTSCIAGECR